MARVVNIIRDAGKTVIEVYATDFESQIKENSSPVTEAVGTGSRTGANGALWG